MTQPTPQDAGRKTQVITIAGKTIVVRELVDLQMMHLARYANILQRDDVDTLTKLDVSEKMLGILHACVANDADRQILVAAEEAGEVSLGDLVSFVKAFQAPEDVKPVVRRGRGAARLTK